MIINDCKDENAKIRQLGRFSALFGFTPGFIGVQNDIEAAGNLIDALDATMGRKGVVLVNVAPRNGVRHKWDNGTPFSYFYYGETLVVISVDGLTLSLVKKLGIVEAVNIFDIPTVVAEMQKQGEVSEELAYHITHTQFRSLEFVPRVADWVVRGLNVPSEEWSLDNVGDIGSGMIWYVDNFGNCKTTMLHGEANFEEGEIIKTAVGDLKFYRRLADVPKDEAAVIMGSSGFEGQRFVELVVQGKSAAERFDLGVGKQLLV